jgi:hypothetical protein
MEGCGTTEPVCKCRVRVLALVVSKCRLRVLALVVKRVEPLLHFRLTLWMGVFCNFAEVACIVNSEGTDVGTLYVN